MNKCTLYTMVYMATLLLLAGCLCEWASPLRIGGLSYGCGEEMPIFTVDDCIKTIVSAVILCVGGIIGIHFVLWKCATHDNLRTGDK